jgi:hypothetical protein
VLAAADVPVDESVEAVVDVDVADVDVVASVAVDEPEVTDELVASLDTPSEAEEDADEEVLVVVESELVPELVLVDVSELVLVDVSVLVTVPLVESAGRRAVVPEVVVLPPPLVEGSSGGEPFCRSAKFQSFTDNERRACERTNEEWEDSTGTTKIVRAKRKKCEIFI